MLFNCTDLIRCLQYLGCILGLKEWQFSVSRAEFMELIDEAQVMHLDDAGCI